MAKDRILICGATGFIGRNIAERLVLRDDLEVLGVYHQSPPYELEGMSWRKADLRREDQVALLVRDVDAIIQAAATTSGIGDMSTQPHIHITDNAIMNSLLLRACHDYCIRDFLFFSCSLMYPSSHQPAAEGDWSPDAALPPPYFGIAHTKLYIEKMCEFFAMQGITSHTVLRLTNAYGPYDKYDLERSKFFGATVTKVLTTTDDHIEMWGAGDACRDLIYVSDIVDLVESALFRDGDFFEIYNCGAGEARPLKDIANMIIKESGRQLGIKHDLTKPSVSNALSFNCDKATERFGWHPKHSLEDGIKKTISWWRQTYAS